MDQQPGKGKYFNIHDFRDWLASQKDLSDFFNIAASDDKEIDELAGRSVMAKVSSRKLLEKIDPKDGDADQLVEDFMETGGTIIESKGKNFHIEVAGGSFMIPRFCVKLV